MKLLSAITSSCLLTIAITLAVVGPLFGATVIACAGTSVTMAAQYPEMVQKMLGTGYTVYNEGAGGADVGFGWNYYLGTTTAAQVFSLKPNIITMEFGANDAHDDSNDIDAHFVAKYEAVMDSFAKITPKPVVWPIIPPPTFTSAQVPGSTETQAWVNCMAHIRTQTRIVIAQRNLPVIDFYTPLANHPEYWVNDGCHPPAQGAAADTMANVLYRALKGSTTVSAAVRTPNVMREMTIANNRVTVNVADHVDWTLVITALNGKQLFRCAGTGATEKIVTGKYAGYGALIVHLFTATGAQMSAKIQSLQ